MSIDFAQLLSGFIVLLISLTVHEASHAWTADYFGDYTARYLGRVTLNPIAHMDVVGTVVFPILNFVTGLPLIGWAKPVPVNPGHLRKPSRDHVLVSLAGPASNLVAAIAAFAVLGLFKLTSLHLGSVVDLEAVARAKIRIGVDPLGGANVAFWDPIAARYGLDVTVVNRTVDPTFGFMTVDKDGKIRMDCSSPYAMTGLIAMKDRFDVAFANDTDADRHGIVSRSGGLMNPNHYLAVAIDYLFRNRAGWRADAAIGKTIVSSAVIDRVAARLGRRLVEVPVFTPDIHYGSVYLYYEQQVLRERPLGYSTTAPREADIVARHLQPLNCGDWTTGVADRLRILKVSSITLHRGLFIENPLVPDTASIAWEGLVANGWRPVRTDGAVTTFVRGRSTASPPFPDTERGDAIFCGGWFPQDQLGHLVGHRRE